MEQGNALPSPLRPFGRIISSGQHTLRDLEEDSAQTPTHNEEHCEICQVHRQHLSIPRSQYPGVPKYDSLGATPTTAPAQSFEDGVKLGLRLQKESDDILLNQYRKRLMRAEAERDISRRSQFDVERLERELEETRDMLLAVQLSYEESVVAHTSVDLEFDNPGKTAAVSAHWQGGGNEDSASQLTLDGAEATPSQERDVVSNQEAAHAETRPGSLYASGEAPVDSTDDDEDLFVWEQLKALDEGDQEEFWRSIYNIEDR